MSRSALSESEPEMTMAESKSPSTRKSRLLPVLRPARPMPRVKRT